MRKTSIKNERLKELLRLEAAKFLERESNRTSLITVTGITLSMRDKKATLLMTVYPEDREKDALSFAKRKRSEFRNYLLKEIRLGYAPTIEFEIDRGEKNRQKIEELLNKR